MSSTATTQQSQPINRVCTAEYVMFELCRRTASSLSHEELSWFARITEGLGCLISTDGNLEPGNAAGNFRDSADVSGLLFNSTNQLQTIAGLIHIGDSAAHRLYMPEACDHEKGGV